MTVEELQEFLKDAPKDALIVMCGPDHSFSPVRRPVIDKAISENGGTLSEDHGSDLDLGETLVDIVVIL